MRINVQPTFKQEVKIETAEGIETCMGHFRAIPFSELETFDLNTPEGTKAAMIAVVISFDELTDPKEKPMAYSEEVRDWMLDQPIHRAAVFTAYAKGIEKAATGN